MRKTICMLLVLLLTAGLVTTGGATDILMEGSEGSILIESDSGEFFGSTDAMTGSGTLPTELAVSGTQVWRVQNDALICEDTAYPDAEPVALPVAELIREDAAAMQLPADETAELSYISVISGDDEKIRLCVALLDENGTVHTALNQLTAGAGEIQISGTADVTGPMSVFFGEDADWLEVNMTGLADGVLVYALDDSLTFQVFRYTAEAPECAKVAEVSLMSCTAMIPYGEKVLIVGPSEDVLNKLDLTVLSPENGEMTLMKSLDSDADVYMAMNFAYVAKDNILCYTNDNIAYRISLDSESIPVPFASLEETPWENRTGAVAGDRYVVFGESGELLVNDLRAEMQSVRIRVSDMTADEWARDIAADYNASRKQAFVTVSDRGDVESILTEMLNQSDDYDIYITEMSGSDYSALKARGYLTELNGGEAVRAGVADMPEYIRKGVLDGDRLLAVPVASAGESITFNVDAFQAVTGLSRDELPTDWTGFLELLGKIAEDRTLDGNTEYTVYDTEMTAGYLKETLFAWILQDCLLWVNQDENRISELPAVLTPILQALDRVDWTGLGLPEEEPDELSWLYSGETVSLLSAVIPEVQVLDLEKGTEFWPLSVTAGGERLIPRLVSVMWINPRSAHQEEALDFVNYYWENLDIIPKMTLCQSLNEPVINTMYDEDLAFFEEMIPEYRDAIANASTEEEAEMLRWELADMEEFMNDYRENAQWSASEQSIALFRSLSGQMVLAVPEFWSADEEDAAVLQYLDGMMSADQFVNALVSTLQMQAIENQ